MKRKLKRKMISLIFATMLLISCTITAFAAGENCLDVRDYGYHRYAQRDHGCVGVDRTHMNEVSHLNTGTKFIDVYEFEWHSWECVCGLRQNKDCNYRYLYTIEIPYYANPSDYYWRD